MSPIGNLQTEGDLERFIEDRTGQAMTGLRAMAAAGVSTPEVTALPAGAAEGRTVDLVVDAAAAMGGPVLWRMKMRAGVWVRVGGEDLLAGPAGSVTGITNATVGALTSGPSITVPFAGVYRVALGLYGQLTAVGVTGLVGAIGVNGVGQGTTTNGRAYQVATAQFGGGRFGVVSRLSLAAGDVLTAMVATDQTFASNFSNATLEVGPVRLS